MVVGEATIGAGNRLAVQVKKMNIEGTARTNVRTEALPVNTKVATTRVRTVRAGGPKAPTAQREPGVPASGTSTEAATTALEAAEKAREKAEKLAAEAEAKKAAQKMVEEGVALFGGNEKDPRMILKLLSGGRATIEALSSQKAAEVAVVDGENISDPAKQEKFEKIKEKYQRLSQYAANRQEITKKNIEKMKKSKNPEHQALGLDLEIAMIRADVNSYDEEIKRRNAAMEIRKAQTGNNLDPAEIKKHETIIEALTAEKAELTKKIEGESEKEGLKTQRAKIKDKDGRVIPDIVKQTAIALTGGDAEAVKMADENPGGYIEGIMADALTDEVAMDQLVANLNRPEVGLIKDDKDKAEFKKFMALGLTPEEKAGMITSKGSKVLLGFSGILGLLAYLSWKKSQEGGGQQMG